MKVQIRLLPLVMLSLLMSLPALAMPPGMMGGYHDSGRHLERMAEKLELSDEQKTEVDAIIEKHRQAMKPLLKQGHDLRKAMHETDPAELSKRDITRLSRERGEQAQAMTRQMLETKRAFHRVLTEEQREQLKQMRAERHERMKERFKEKHGHP